MAVPEQQYTPTNRSRATVAWGLAAVIALIYLMWSVVMGSAPEPSTSPTVSGSATAADDGGGDPDPEPEPSIVEQLRQFPANTTEPPPPAVSETARPAAAGVQAAAAGFVRTYVALPSNRWPTPGAWARALAPYTTAAYGKWLQQNTTGTGSPGAEWMYAHQNNLDVAVTVGACSHPAGEPVTVVSCPVTVRTMRAQKPLPINKVDQGSWSFFLPQPNQILRMQQENGSWKVAQVLTHDTAMD